MKRGQRPSAEQVVLMLRQIEVQTAQGKSIAVACKEADVSEQSYYRWRKEYGGLKVDQARKMKDLERENARLRRLVADLSLEKQILADVASGNLYPPSDAGRRSTAFGRSMVSRNFTPAGSSASTERLGLRHQVAYEDPLHLSAFASRCRRLQEQVAACERVKVHRIASWALDLFLDRCVRRWSSIVLSKLRNISDSKICAIPENRRAMGPIVCDMALTNSARCDVNSIFAEEAGVDGSTMLVGSDQSDIIDLTANLVAAYVANNSVPIAELPALLSGIHTALAGLAAPSSSAEPTADKATPAKIRKSITPDALISFIDGKPYKTLKRHLNRNGMTIELYRERFGLPRDYPSTAASYSEHRSALAIAAGLGNQRRKAAPNAAEPAEIILDKPKRGVGRPRKAKVAAEA